MINLTLKQFSELAASKDPTPGGGGVCGLVGSLASSLGQMVTNLTYGKAKYIQYTSEIIDIRKELDILRTNLLDCINKDKEAFEPLAKAYKMDKNDPNYESTMEKCLKIAANVPFLILKYCARIIVLDERLAVIGSKISVSDAGTSVMLAHGALYGAYINVLVNTRLMKNREYADDFTKQAAYILDEYSVRALNCYDDVCKRLTDNG